VNGADRLLAACRREAVDATPVWFMRQAGGSLPGYLRLRERHSVMEIAKTPALCAEVTHGAVDAFGVDGAVLFADVMLPVEAMGVTMELSAEGPLIAEPIQTREDVERLRAVDVAADLGFVLEAIVLSRQELGDRAAVIGICGGPFTLAAYLIEGGPSRDQLQARAFMHRDPETWHALMARIADVTVDYLRAQVAAGAQLVQVFDSWAGSLSARDYEAFVSPYAARVLAAVADSVPVIHFAAGSSAILESLAAAGGSVIGVDSRQPLGDAWRRIGYERGIQGNLDPSRLLAGRGPTEAGAREVLAQAQGRPGHIFNLGHAAPRAADPALLRDLVSLVHDESAAAPHGTAVEMATAHA
jgi:uroporphyrinogen decarboxylase